MTGVGGRGVKVREVLKVLFCSGPLAQHTVVLQEKGYEGPLLFSEQRSLLRPEINVRDVTARNEYAVIVHF